ncbi:MAG: helix-turn-helix domain-containing protein [Candidatus Woesearchaeota archaeon]
MSEKKGEPFVLVSLEEKKLKQIADALSSETAKAIMSLLSERQSATETEISEALNVPISTVHYNLKKLIESGLVVSNEFHYSSKGKEVNHYSLANKYIIITPKKEEKVSPDIRSILIAALAVVIGTITIWTLPILERSSWLGMHFWKEKSMPKCMVVQPQTSLSSSQQLQFAPQQNVWQWFLLGGLVAVVVMLATFYIRSRKKN